MRLRLLPLLATAAATGDGTAAGQTAGNGQQQPPAKPGGTSGDGTTNANPEAGKAGKDGQQGDGQQAQQQQQQNKGNEPPPAKKAPDKYELKIPEKSTLNDSDVKAIETIARENGWTNEEAQLALQHHHDTLLEQSAQFLEATKADKTYGGENLARSQARAKAVIDKIRPATHPRAAAFKALLDRSGYGNHIEIVSFLADLGAQLDEDGGATGDGTAGQESKDAAAVLYGGSKKKE